MRDLVTPPTPTVCRTGGDYAALSAVDRDGALSAEELERLAVAAFLLGRDDEVRELRRRALDAHLARGLDEKAAECGLWLGFHLDLRGELAQAAGWRLLLHRRGNAASSSARTGPIEQVRAGDPLMGGELPPVNTVVWCTGSRPDYRFLEIPMLGDDGRPRHRRGVSAAPGLYLLGLEFRFALASGQIQAWTATPVTY